MTLGHPLVDAALDDLRLTPLHLKVFRVMWRDGDFEEFVPMKSEVLAREVGCDRANASRSLQRLVDLGYLEVRSRGPTSVGEYRLSSEIPLLVHNEHKVEAQPRARRQVRYGL